MHMFPFLGLAMFGKECPPHYRAMPFAPTFIQSTYELSFDSFQWDSPPTLFDQLEYSGFALCQ